MRADHLSNFSEHTTRVSARNKPLQTVAHRTQSNYVVVLIDIPSSSYHYNIRTTMNTALYKYKTSVLDAESEGIVQQALDDLINSSWHTVMTVALQFSKMGPL